MRRGKGFTLIELLVVVAVIALLLAILAPTMSRVSILSRRVMCGSNLRQYAIAMHAYMITNKGVFPACHSSGWPLTQYNTWLGAVYDYGPNERLGQCPAIQGTQSDYGVSWDWEWNGSHNGYGMNMWFLGGSHDPARQNEYAGTRIKMDRDVRISSVRAPAKCIMFGDTNPKTGGNGEDWGCTISLFWPFAGPDRYREGVCDSRHANAGMVGFVDGHVQVFVDPNNTINPPYCGARTFLEYWDRLQRVDLGL